MWPGWRLCMSESILRSGGSWERSMRWPAAVCSAACACVLSSASVVLSILHKAGVGCRMGARGQFSEGWAQNNPPLANDTNWHRLESPGRTFFHFYHWLLIFVRAREPTPFFSTRADIGVSAQRRLYLKHPREWVASSEVLKGHGKCHHRRDVTKEFGSTAMNICTKSPQPWN